MQSDSEELLNELIEFETPTPQSGCCGLNPNGAGYRKRVALCSLLLFVTCVVLGIFGCGLWIFSPIVGIVAVGVAIFMIAVIGWLTLRTEFCPICGARTKNAWTGMKRTWCPGCQNLNDPQQILVGDSKVLDLSGPEYTCHRDPIPRYVSMAILLAVYDEGHELRFEPTKDVYNVIVVCDYEAYEVIPPPLFIHFRVAQAVKAIAGLDLSNCSNTQEGHIDIRVRDRIVPTDVTVQPTEFGQKVVFRWSKRGLCHNNSRGRKRG